MKLPLSRVVKAEISGGELVHFQRMARRTIQVKQSRAQRDKAVGGGRRLNTFCG